jgi:hypothetical protein
MRTGAGSVEQAGGPVDSRLTGLAFIAGPTCQAAEHIVKRQRTLTARHVQWRLRTELSTSRRREGRVVHGIGSCSRLPSAVIIAVHGPTGADPTWRRRHRVSIRPAWERGAVRVRGHHDRDPLSRSNFPAFFTCRAVPLPLHVL